MVLLVAPISTAGAFSTEMARGHIFLMLVTGMTPAEIVCGTLCARLLPALSGVACVVPVLVLSSQLAGISIVTLIDLEIVTAGTALVGCTLALSLSIGARRLHETLMATYVILVGWVLGPPILLMIGTTSVGRFVPGWLTGWLLSVNPYWLILGPIVRPGFYRPHEPWSFVAGTTVLALALAVFTAWRLRPTALAVAGGARARPWLSRLVRYRPLVSLDSHPVFWRECRLQQPSRWTRVLWRMYVAGAILFTALAVWECATKGPVRTLWAGPFNGFQAAVGLLLLSVVTPAALAEDRARGSLELLLSTPISTRTLVLSKWCAITVRYRRWQFCLQSWRSRMRAVPAMARRAAGVWIGAGAGSGRDEPGDRAGDLDSAGRSVRFSLRPRQSS